MRCNFVESFEKTAGIASTLAAPLKGAAKYIGRKAWMLAGGSIPAVALTGLGAATDAANTKAKFDRAYTR